VLKNIYLVAMMGVVIVIGVSVLLIGCTASFIFGSGQAKLNTHAPLTTDEESYTETDTNVGDSSSEIKRINERIDKRKEEIKEGQVRGEEALHKIEEVEHGIEDKFK